MIGCVDIPSLDGGFLGESITLRSYAPYCARPVKNASGEFMGILFGSEDGISSEDIDEIVTDTIKGQSSGIKKSKAPRYYGWTTFYSVNPTVTKGSKSIGSSADGHWSFINGLLPSQSVPKDFYSFLFNYGHRMNKARDDEAFNGKDAHSLLKDGSFEILFYACSYGGPLSS